MMMCVLTQFPSRKSLEKIMKDKKNSTTRKLQEKHKSDENRKYYEEDLLELLVNNLSW